MGFCIIEGKFRRKEENAMALYLVVNVVIVVVLGFAARLLWKK
jgi:hypothetical protein